MIHMNDLKDLKLYKSSNILMAPLANNNNKYGSIIYLLTSSIQSSIDLINSHSVMYRNWYRSYYVDKSVNAIIKDNGELKEFVKYDDPELDTLIETKLSAKDRKALDEKDFGIPSKRAYPLNDEEHVRQAIRMFNHCDAADEKELARRIIKKIKYYDMTDLEVGDNNRFSKYYHTLKEYEYKTAGMFPIEWLTDYRFTYFDRPEDIKKKLKDCEALINTTTDHARFGQMSTNVKFLAKCYSGTDLAAFGTGYKDYGGELEFGIYIQSDYFQNEDAKIEITKYMLKLYQDYMMQNQTKVKVVKVYSMNNDKEFIKELRTSFIKDGSFIDRSRAFSLTGGKRSNSKNNNLHVYVDLDAYTANKEDKKKVSININPLSETVDAGIRQGDKVYLFDNEIFNEDFTDNTLRRYLYDERIRTQKELMDVYSLVKNQCYNISYTKQDVSQYKGLNLFFDVSYYHKIFLEKNGITGERGLNLYVDTLSRLLNNKVVDSNYAVKTIFIPIHDYVVRDLDIFDFRKNINPISTLVRLIRTGNFSKIQQIFKDTNIIFFGSTGYFKINFSTFKRPQLNRFISNIRSLVDKVAPTEDDGADTPTAIASNIVATLDSNRGLNLYGALGKALTKSKTNPDTEKEGQQVELKKVTVSKVKATNIANQPKDTKTVKKEVIEQEKDEVVDKIIKVANNSKSMEDAVQELSNDEHLSTILQDITDEESSELKVSATRKARIETLNNNFTQQKIRNRSVYDLLNSGGVVHDLKTTQIPINSINNEQWDNMKFMNFNESYHIDADIANVIRFFGRLTVPVSTLNIDVENTSNTEDYKDTWTVKMEDIAGSRFTLKFDIPKLKARNLMRLRGNDKTINSQLMNLPIIKTDTFTAQITTNYNKIFLYVFGNATGKSTITADMVHKLLQKYTGNKIEYRIGSNAMTAMKYEVPIDYADLGSSYSYITEKGKQTWYFDQDEIRTKYSDKIDLKKGLPVAVTTTGQIVYYDGSVPFSSMLAKSLNEIEGFNNGTFKPAVKYSYSQASILNTKMPVVLICAYCEGLTKTLNRANIEYRILDKRERIGIDEDMIKFKDGYLVYKVNYQSSLLMNGLKDCNTGSYSIKDMNNKSMWTEQLDDFGGRIKADGLDNFYDLMFDPLTQYVCRDCNIPDNFCGGLIYASDLLSDTKYNKHTDITSNRLRSGELISGYTYKILSSSYAEYRTKLKKTGKAAMTVKQTAIIDAILSDNTCSDISAANDLNYADSANTVSFKGLSGLNSDRSYSLEKRTYDESMTNILGMSTGFASTVGVTRVATANAAISNSKGYIPDNVNSKMNDVNTMTIGENLTPMSTTHDDPFRLAMSYVQRQKHDLRVSGGDPLLITNGMDDALSNFTPDYFSFNAKADGKVIEMDEHHIVIQYKPVDKTEEGEPIKPEKGEIDYIDLDNNTFKNSDGGFYASIKLTPVKGLKVGSTVKQNQLLAYDKFSYSPETGYDDSATYNQGTLAKVAIITSDKGFEDSCIVSSYISDALSNKVVMQVPVALDKNTNVFNLVKVGDKVQEGDPLIILQNSYEDNDVNILLKNLVDDEDTVTSLGRIPIKSHNTGIIEDIKIFRTCDITDMSPSLKKIVTAYEKEKNVKAKQVAKYDTEKAKEYEIGKLPQLGKLKNLEDGVLIEIYVSYKDDFSVGDKLIFLGAQKGVAKEVMVDGTEPRSSYRPDEPIDAIASMVSFDKRMCCAPLQYLLAGKIMVELDRQVKDILGIKHDNTIRHTFDEFGNKLS